jgi:cell division protein FtsB
MEKKNFLRFVIIATAIFLVVLLVKKDSVLRWVQTGFELRRQRKEIEYYEKQIRDLDSRIESLSTNRDTLEAYAREQFLFSEPGDDVYLEP